MFARSRKPSVETAPPWFTAALQHQPQHHDVDVLGCQIHARSWGDPTRPPLVLVHGGGAHSGWWDHIAPFFLGTHWIIAPDLSGHGDSAYRESYDLDAWSGEVVSVVEQLGSTTRPTMVGHSMGGWVVANAARRYRSQINGIIVIDSPLRDRAPEGTWLRDRKNTVYPRKKDILARFKAVPAQDFTLPYVARHIARESIRRVPGGWTWKFDRQIFSSWLLNVETQEEKRLLIETITETPCRTGYLRCESGSVAPDMAARIREMLELRGPFVDLPAAGHHPMLDQPLALVTALRTLLEFWSIT